MDLSKINSIGGVEKQEVLKIKDLEVGVTYPINNFKAFHSTKINQRCITVEHEGKLIFLPKRLTQFISDEMLLQLNEQKLGLIFSGEVDVQKPSPACKVSFINLE